MMRSMKILIAVALSVAFASSAWASYPYSMTYTVSAGDTILADHYNTANNEHINSNIPENIDDYSANATEMQSTSDPYPASAESLAITLDGELQRLRYVLAQITQESQWYHDPPTFMENSADYDHVAYDLTLGGKIVFDVSGSGIGSDGSINFATNIASIWSDGTDLFGMSTGDIILNAAGDNIKLQASTVTILEILSTGIIATVGAIDFGGADSFEVPNAASPTVDAAGELALKINITGHTGLMTYYDGTETHYLIGIPTGNLTTTDNHVISYNASSNEFEMVAPSSPGATTALDNLASVQINETLISDTDITDDLGSGDVRWKDAWFETLSSGLTAADTLKLRGRDVNGATYIDVLTITSNDTVTADLWASTTIGSAAIVTPASTSTFTNKTFDANGTGNSLSNVDVSDLADGTDGELITWDSSGNATTVAVGTASHVLTSNGSGAEPTFQTSVLEYIRLHDSKSTTTEGGGFTQDAWQKRTVTEDQDTGNNVTVSSSVITLEAGTYDCFIIATAFKVDQHQMRLRNTSDSATTFLSVIGNATSVTPGASDAAILQGRFTIASQKVFEIQHYCKTTKTTNGFGSAGGTGENEIYLVAEFWKQP